MNGRFVVIVGLPVTRVTERFVLNASFIVLIAKSTSVLPMRNHVLNVDRKSVIGARTGVKHVKWIIVKSVPSVQSVARSVV